MSNQAWFVALFAGMLIASMIDVSESRTPNVLKRLVEHTRQRRQATNHRIKRQSDEPSGTPAQDYISHSSHPLSSLSYGQLQHGSSYSLSDDSSASSSDNGGSSASYNFPDRIAYASLTDPAATLSPSRPPSSAKPSTYGSQYNSASYGQRPYSSSYGASQQQASRGYMGQGSNPYAAGSSSGSYSPMGSYAYGTRGGGYAQQQQPQQQQQGYAGMSTYSMYQPQYAGYAGQMSGVPMSPYKYGQNSVGYNPYGTTGGGYQGMTSYGQAGYPTGGNGYPYQESNPYGQGGGYQSAMGSPYAYTGSQNAARSPYGQSASSSSMSYYNRYGGGGYAGGMTAGGTSGMNSYGGNYDFSETYTGHTAPDGGSEGTDIRIGSSSTRYNPSTVESGRSSQSAQAGHSSSAYPYGSTSGQANYASYPSGSSSYPAMSGYNTPSGRQSSYYQGSQGSMTQYTGTNRMGVGYAQSRSQEAGNGYGQGMSHATGGNYGQAIPSRTGYGQSNLHGTSMGYGQSSSSGTGYQQGVGMGYRQGNTLGSSSTNEQSYNYGERAGAGQYGSTSRTANAPSSNSQYYSGTSSQGSSSHYSRVAGGTGTSSSQYLPSSGSQNAYGGNYGGVQSSASYPYGSSSQSGVSSQQYGNPRGLGQERQQSESHGTTNSGAGTNYETHSPSSSYQNGIPRLSGVANSNMYNGNADPSASIYRQEDAHAEKAVENSNSYPGLTAQSNDVSYPVPQENPQDLSQYSGTDGTTYSDRGSPYDALPSSESQRLYSQSSSSEQGSSEQLANSQTSYDQGTQYGSSNSYGQSEYGGRSDSEASRTQYPLGSNSVESARDVPTETEQKPIQSASSEYYQARPSETYSSSSSSSGSDASSQNNFGIGPSYGSYQDNSIPSRATASETNDENGNGEDTNSLYIVPSRSRGRDRSPAGEATDNNQVSQSSPQSPSGQSDTSQQTSNFASYASYGQEENAYQAGYDDPYSDGYTNEDYNGPSDTGGDDNTNESGTNVQSQSETQDGSVGQESSYYQSVQTGVQAESHNSVSDVSASVSNEDADARQQFQPSEIYEDQTGTLILQRTNRRNNMAENVESQEEITQTSPPPLLPDLKLDHRKLFTHFFLDRNTPYRSLMCAKEEGCLPSDNSRFYTQSKKLLRFQTTVRNIGKAPFLPALKKKDWTWHQCHNHSHSMKIFTHYDLLNVTTREKEAEGHKASFCLEDSSCDHGIRKVYNCDKGHQGISPGCEDTYKASIDCQWIDVTNVVEAEYIFRVTINPDRLVPESDYSNNGVECSVEIKRFTANIWNCRFIGV
ncbi:uncharacterized protein LOC143464816 [Clavelina lepadiformis]|uniref:uncharacterized protein LOC143464816 n=1 Tax=Clavelina lepadiformis TaxID=159417 RepID=UPI0040416248